jgi:hypothetical protein
MTKQKKQYLKEMFEASNGSLSHFIFLRDQPKSYLKELKTEGWIKFVKNSENNPMYLITPQLKQEFGGLSDLEIDQLANRQKEVAEEARVEAEEEARAQANLEKRTKEI